MREISYSQKEMLETREYLRKAFLNPGVIKFGGLYSSCQSGDKKEDKLGCGVEKILNKEQ